MLWASFVLIIPFRLRQRINSSLKCPFLFFSEKNVNSFPDLSKPRISDWIMSNFRTGASVFPTFSGGSAQEFSQSWRSAKNGARTKRCFSHQASLSFIFSFLRSFFTKPTPWKGYKTSDNSISWTGPNFHKLISVGKVIKIKHLRQLRNVKTKDSESEQIIVTVCGMVQFSPHHDEQ